MKNIFTFFLFQLFLFSRYLSSCIDILVMYKNALFRKMKLNSKFMASLPGKQTIAMHILPNTSKSKGNQEMIFPQFI